jgi:hypothetical protein
LRRYHETFLNAILTSDPLSAISPAERTPIPSESSEPIGFRPENYVCRVIRDSAMRVAPPTPLPSDPAPFSATHVSTTTVTDARLRRVSLEFGASRGLRRHGRARH